MERTRSFCRRAVCAAAVALQAGAVWGQSELPTCATVADQVVSVTSQQATAFRVGVENLGRGYVSIYQHPLGGTLVPGSTSADFVFIPDDGFVGTTTFMFRVTPEPGCPRGALLGKVTFVGSTTGRQFAGAEKTGLCGVGAPMVTAAGSVMVGMGFGRRRRRRHSSLADQQWL
jgi:hypothetical protein